MLFSNIFERFGALVVDVLRIYDLVNTYINILRIY
jgi:hypothetical protein